MCPWAPPALSAQDLKALATSGYEKLNRFDYQGALEDWQKGLDLAYREQDSWGIAALTSNIGTAYQYLGEYPKALELFRASLKNFKDGGSRKGEAGTCRKLDAAVAALTACKTGLGRQQGGEGVMGLGRAFQYAGARNVLVSLWSVSEKSTTLMVERFFAALKTGKGPPEALRQARGEVRAAGYEHPFYWAPFILMGN